MARLYYAKELKEFLSKVPDDTSVCLDCGNATNGRAYEGWENIGWEHCDCNEGNLK